MPVQVLLLRGINVGGHGKLPMAELRAILTDLGAANVQTYIQSGNAVFKGNLRGDLIADAIKAAKGFHPKTMLLDGDAFAKIAAATPFEVTKGKLLHIWFTKGKLDFDNIKAETLRKPSERISVGGKAIYLYAPEGIGRSKLAAMVEKLAGVACTARNWNTVAKLRDMAALYE